jgi:hypothetical protein
MPSPFLIAFFLLSIVPIPPDGPPERLWSGKRLLPACEAVLASKEEDSFEQGRCVGFVVGLDYSNTLLVAAHQLPAYCRPADVTNVDQSIRVLVDYLKKNRSSLDKDAGVLALSAFHEAWPCKLR